MKKVRMTVGSYTGAHVPIMNKGANGQDVPSGQFETKRIAEGESFDCDDAEAARLLRLGVAEIAKG